MVEAFYPATLQEALTIRAMHRVIPFAGGTDLMVRRKSWAGTLPRFEEPVLFLGGLEELQSIDYDAGLLTIGAAARLAALLENAAVPELLKQAVSGMAAPAVRNAGTLGGNLCNASPAADTLPPLYALGAAVVLQSSTGRRILPIEAFILGPGRIDLAGNELLVAVEIPGGDWPVTDYRKVGTRKADALSKVSFAGAAQISAGRVAGIRMALGAVAPRVVRSNAMESWLVEKPIAALSKLLPEIEAEYSRLIQPIDDQRSSAEYRSKVALRLIVNFLNRLGQTGVK